MDYKGLAFLYEDYPKKIVSLMKFTEIYKILICLFCFILCICAFLLICLGQWNLTALPVAEESLLLEAEVHLGEFEKSNMDSTESDVEIAEDSVATLSIDEREDFPKSITLNETDILAPEKEPVETDVEPEICDVVDAPQVTND